MRTIFKIGIGIVVWSALGALTFAAANEQPLKLTLDECLKLGFQNNLKVVEAEQRIAIAAKEVREKFAGFLPSFGYKIEWSKLRSEAPSYNFFTGQTFTQTSKSEVFSEGVSLTQTLYAGGSIKADYQIALLKLESAQEDKRRSEQELTYNIKAAFYNLWLKQQNYQTVLASQENMAKHYELTNRMYRIGSKNKLDLYQARVGWEEQKVAALMTSNEVAEARLTLANLIGVDKLLEFMVDFDISKFNSEVDVVNDPQLTIAMAYQERPELRQMKQSIAIAEYQIKKAKAGHLPIISLSGSYGMEDEKFLGNTNQQWALAVNLSGVFFDGYATENRIAYAQESLKLIKNQEAQWQDQVMGEVIQTIRSIKEAKNLIDSNRLNIDLAKETIYLTELQYNNGKASTSDFKDSQMSLIQALDGYYGQVINYLIYSAKLDYVTGKDVFKDSNP